MCAPPSQGTIRALTTEQQAQLRDRIRTVATAVTSMYGLAMELEFGSLAYGATRNDAGLVRVWGEEVCDRGGVACEW